MTPNDVLIGNKGLIRCQGNDSYTAEEPIDGLQNVRVTPFGAKDLPEWIRKLEVRQTANGQIRFSEWNKNSS